MILGAPAYLEEPFVPDSLTHSQICQNILSVLSWSFHTIKSNIWSKIRSNIQRLEKKWILNAPKLWHQGSLALLQCLISTCEIRKAWFDWVHLTLFKPYVFNIHRPLMHNIIWASGSHTICLLHAISHTITEWSEEF